MVLEGSGFRRVALVLEKRQQQKPAGLGAKWTTQWTIEWTTLREGSGSG